MKISFKGEVEDLMPGIKQLNEDLNFTVSDNGIQVLVKRGEKIKITIENESVIIEHKEKIHFFRALGLLIETLEKGETNKVIEEEILFDTNGAMFDVSRNAVLKVDSIKRIFKYMAIMGLNIAMLYSEDTYEVKEYPYFGYMRGRYSETEIKECDDYADVFGIELIPCIQTLAHLSQPLKWDAFSDICDTEDILLIGEEKTYKFIEAMIRAAIKPLRTKKIHLGMDEAHYVGLGNYLRKNGYKDRFEILSDHLDKVIDITNKFELEPMMWSDMFFRLASKTGDYEVNAKLPQELLDRIPKNLSFVYWDYYRTDQDSYENQIKMHEKLNNKTIFAGGIWTWMGMCPQYKFTFNATNAALLACKKQGIKDVFATMWGDNGGEVNALTSILGLQLFAEHTYHENPSLEWVKERFEFCTKESADAFFALSMIDEIPEPGNEDDIRRRVNPSKYLLFQDILTGIFDKNLEKYDLTEHFIRCGNVLADYASTSSEYQFLFDYYYKLSKVLTVKWDLGIRIKQFYDKKDMVSLESVVQNDLNTLYKFVVELKEAHRKSWYKTNKPFGFETIDIRYGGVLSRIDTTAYRLNQFISGEIEKIEELEEERLLYSTKLSDGLILCYPYARIATVGIL